MSQKITSFTVNYVNFTLNMHNRLPILSTNMRQDTDLLWIRSAAPGSGDTGLVESLDRFIIHAAHEVEDALARLRGEAADVILAEFPLPGWTPSELLEAIQQINPRLLV